MPEHLTKQLAREQDTAVPDKELPTVASVTRRQFFRGTVIDAATAEEKYGLGGGRLHSVVRGMEEHGYRFERREDPASHTVSFRLLNPKHTVSVQTRNGGDVKQGGKITPAAPKRQRRQPVPVLPPVGAQVEVVMTALDGPSVAVRGDGGQWLCKIIGYQRPETNDEES